MSVHRAGYGFVRTPELAESVFLPPAQTRGVMHGDRVRLAVRRDAQGRYLGEVLAVLERGVQGFLGTVEAEHGGLRVRPADRRLRFTGRVAGREPAVRAGDWVIARLLEAPRETAPPQVRIERVLDPERPVEMADEAAIARFALPVEFSAQALLEAQHYGHRVDAAEAARRIDLRELPLVTIDGADARDFDDAVWAQRLEDGGFRLIVAIADVGHYVRPGSALDREARERGTSVYFPTRVLPMLPTALSNHLCSLEPQVDRLCMAVDMRLSRRGELQESRLYEAVMRSAARLTYAQAHAALFRGESSARETLGGALLEALAPLVEVYGVLAAARRRRGALDFDAPETRFLIDADRQVQSVQFVTRNDAHRLIEECMILANVAVARELARRGVPALLRVHAPPDEKKLDQLRETLRILGIDPQLPEPLHARDLGAIATRVRDPQERPFIESLIVRSLAQALYQGENLGHFGLALPHYVHFTSPIRRYPDLMVHRAVRALLAPAARETLAQGAELAAAGTDLSRLERRADEAARFVSSFLKCVYLRDRIGQTFEGLITTVMEFGCFVQLLDIGIDGLLPLGALSEAGYQAVQRAAAPHGRQRGEGPRRGHGRRRIAPGVRLRVVVAAANAVEGRVDLELATD